MLNESPEFDKNKQTEKLIFHIKKMLLIAEHLCYPGNNSLDIDKKIGKYMENHKLISAPKKYYSFPGNICISVNNVVCHGNPNIEEFEEGDIIKVDISIYQNNCNADMCRTFICGEDKYQFKEMITNITNLLISIPEKFNVVDNKYKDTSYIGSIIEEFAKKNNYGIIKEYGGHGIGSLLHMAPFVPNHNTSKKEYIPNNSYICIEPILYKYKCQNTSILATPQDVKVYINDHDVILPKEFVAVHIEDMFIFRDNMLYICSR